MRYLINVTRTSHKTTAIQVDAKNDLEAEEIALQAAYNRDFSNIKENSVEYSIENMIITKNDIIVENNTD